MSRTRIVNKLRMKVKLPLYQRLGFAFPIPKHLEAAVFKQDRKGKKVVWRPANAYHQGDTFYDHKSGYTLTTKEAVKAGMRFGLQVTKLGENGTLAVVLIRYGKRTKASKPKTMTRQKLTQLLRTGIK